MKSRQRQVEVEVPEFEVSENFEKSNKYFKIRAFRTVTSEYHEQ